ncbi:alpha/beta hydrolase-fold protein [Streptomyces sp. LaPpAH-108]|uniref:alpha/beta hydrolase-fold protein n=1 Tax=Streptomyces sp. LaPpAH-108 TaxID=1155714 RepID=UPI000369644D|nr:alpha/beta hydrolase-fold protein [Streptomyces sp. LaPpAH-108]
MTNETPSTHPESPFLARLLTEVRTGGREVLDQFWRDVTHRGTPLVEPLQDAPGERLVTVVWRQDRPVTGVYLLANRVTDKHRVRRGMMRRLDGTDVWYVSLRLPVGLRCAYRIHPFGPDDPHLTPDGPRDGASRLLPDDRTDPLNPHATGPFGSLIELEGAPSLAEWLSPAPSSACRTDAFDFPATDGTTYRVRRFVPDLDDSRGTPGLLVVFDGERWFDQYGITAAVTAAVEAGRMPPLAVLGVEAGSDPAARMRQLGANPAFIDMLADELLPAVTAELPGWAGPRRTVLCGQSLGGLTALATALRRPAAFGAVLAHSASTWWRPGMASRPQTGVDGRDTWLYEQVAQAPVTDVRVRMDVGSNEGTMVDDLHRLHTLMAARGFDASLNVYLGGHDHSCWAAALIEGLAETFAGERASVG